VLPRIFAICLVLCPTIAAHAYAQALSNFINVKQYGALGDGATDDTKAIAAAVNLRVSAGALSVYFPEGTYLISAAIAIPSDIRIFGDGALSIVYQQTPGKNVFQAAAAENSSVAGVTIENMSFRGSGGFQNSYALSLSSARQVVFQNNSASAIPLIAIGSVADSGGSHHSQQFQIRGNHASGQFGEGAAILVAYVSDGEIADNVIDGYDHGIQYWGGDAARHPSMRGVARLKIASNTVSNVAGGIWGSAGDHIEITGNGASNCADVCLDAEGSTHVTFSGNTIRNSVNGGIATFYGSAGVVITSNTVYQDENHGAALYFHGTGVTSDVFVSGNSLQVLGSAPAITTDLDVLAKSEILSNQISSAKSAAIRILEGNAVKIDSNIIRSGAATAIAYEGTSGGFITGNTITNTAGSLALDTTQGAIHILWRSISNPGQHNQIKGNSIIGFPISVNDDCWGDSSSFNTVSGNRVDAIYYRANRQSYHGVIEGNYKNSTVPTLVVGTSY